MQLNATVLKVSPLLATPNEASVASCWHSGTSERCASGVPNEARVASFPASPLGVNRAKQGQMGPRFTPSSSLPRRRSDPLALWERVRVRVPQPVALLTYALLRSFSAKNAIVFSHESAAAPA